MAKKSKTMSYSQYQDKYGDINKGPVSYERYNNIMAERQRQQAEQERLAQEQARRAQIMDLGARATIQKARDMSNPFMNGNSRAQAEMARNAFGYGKTYDIQNHQMVPVAEANPQRRAFNEWIGKLNKAKADKEAGVKPEKKPVPAVQRSPEEIKTEYTTQKMQQLRQAVAEQGLTFDAVEESRKRNKTGNNWTIKQQIELDRQNTKNAEADLLNNAGLPFYMSEEMRKALREESVKTAQEKRKLAEEYGKFVPEEGMAGLYDYVHGLDVKNEENIINNPAYKGTDFESTARSRLAELNGEYNQNRRNVETLAGRGMDGWTDPRELSGYEAEQARARIYDDIMPDTYKERVQGMTYEQKKALDDEIDKAYAGTLLPWGEGNQADAVDSLNREASAWEAQVNAIDEAQNFYDFIQRKRQFAADEWLGDVSQDYDPAINPGAQMEYDAAIGDYVMKPQGSNIDQAAWYANNWQNMGGMEDKLTYAGKLQYVNKYMFIGANPEILDMFNKFYNKDKKIGSNLTEQFLQGLEPYLTSLMVEYQNNLMQSTAQDGVKGTALRAISPALQAVGGVTGTLAAMTGQDLESDLYLPSRITSQTRSRQNEDISKLAAQVFGETGGDVTNFMLNVVDSIADNVFAMGVGTTLAGEGTKAAMRLVQAIMSGSATSNKMVEMLEKGTQPTEAALYAVGDGIIEWLTEKYSLEQIMGPDVKQLLGNKKAIASFVARSAAAEGSEEINSGLLNTGLDYILSMVFDHEDELKQKYNQLVTSGMSDAEASSKVLEDKLAELGMEGLAGAISGGMMAESRVISGAIDNRGTGKKISGKQGGTNAMLDIAQGMAEGTESRKLADDLKTKIEAGEEVSDKDLGRLAKLTSLEADEQYKNKSEAALKESVLQEMEGKDLQGTDKEEAAQVIVKAIKGGSESLSKAERSLLLKDTVLNIYKNYLGDTEQTEKAIGAQLEATEGERKAQKSLAELFENKPQSVDTGSRIVKGATAEDIRLAEQVSEHVKTGTEVLLDGEFKQLDGVEIAKDKDGKLTMQAVVGGQVVPAAAIKATSAGVGRVLGEASLSPEFFSKAFVNTLLDAAAQGQMDNEKAMTDAKKIRLYAYAGFQMPDTGLEKQLANRLYMESTREHAENRKAQTGEGNRKAEGRITFDGVEYGTEEYKQKVKGLTKAARAQMDAIAGIAQRAGIEVDFTDLQDTKVYGSESKKGIRINIGGLNYGAVGEEATGQHNMVVTFGHEMTHWLQRNSAKGYNRLEQFVMQEYRRANGEEELNRRINHHMYSWGLSLEDAMSEIVADSCDQILADENVMRHIENTDRSLFTEVKNFVTNLVDRIKQAVKGMSGSASKDARAMMQSANELAKVWLGAYDDALTGAVQAGAQTAAEGQERLSQAEADDRYMQAVESGNVEEQQKIIDQAAKEAGYTYKAYHGTNRGDRVGNVFLPERATSGPMAYFTSNRDIAQNYASDKADTSIAYDNDYHDEEYEDYDYQFKIKDENGDMVPVRTLWDKLSFAQKRAIKEKAGHVTLDEDGYEVIYDEEATGGPGGFDDYTIREHRGNIIEALTDVWLKSGFLLGQEEEFINVLKLAGIPNEVTWFNPDVSYEKVYDTWLKINNPFRTDTLYNEKFLDDLETWWNEQDQSKYANNGPANNLYAFDKFSITVDNWIAEAREDIKSGDSNSWTRIPDAVTDYLKSQGYDGIIDAGGKRGGIGHTVYIPFTSEQVKSAEPVVYDDNGDVIPPSKRFNQEQKDIRFSMAEPVEERADGLVAVHNLRQDEFIKTLAEGGMAAPSIAVVKASMGHSNYGDVSVVFYPGVIDPKKTVKNKVYGADAYTPERWHARVEQEIVSKEVSKSIKEFNDLMKGENKELINEMSGWFNSHLYDDETDKTLAEIVETAYENVGMLAAYQKEHGNSIDVKMRERVTSNASQENEEAYLDLISGMKPEMLENFINDYKNVYIEDMVDKYAPVFKEILSKRIDRFNRLKLDGSDFEKRVFTSWFRQLYDYLYKGITKESVFDKYGTKDAIQEKTDKNEFISWLTDKLKNVLGDMGIRNNQDRFTSIGKRKTFKQLHKEYTAENVVKAMYENAARKGVGADYFTGLMATTSKEYRSLADVKKDINRLRMIPEEEYSQFIQEKNKEMDDISREIKGNETYPDDVRRTFVEAGKKYAVNPTLSTIKYAFKAEGYTLTDETAEKVKKMMDEAREVATGYFEAKPERVVGIDEIAKVIMPADASEELKQALDNWGVEYVTYDGTDEDRLAKLNEVEGVRFSRSDDSYDVEAWLGNMTYSGLQTEDERILMENFKGLRVSMSLALHKQVLYQSRIKELENRKVLDADARHELETLRQKLDGQKWRMEKLEREMAEVTSSEGYAGMMHKHNMLFKDFISGRTQEQVSEKADQLVQQVKAANKEIEKQRAELNKLAQTQAVKTMKSYLGKSSLQRMTDVLRKTYSTNLPAEEVSDRLAFMALKLADGQDIRADAESLAWDLRDQMRGRQDDTLDYLRGTTFVIGESLANELKAENSSIGEQNEKLRGSGVRLVVYQKDRNGYVADKKSRIKEQWNDLREKNNSLEEYGPQDIDVLHGIVDMISKAMEDARADNQKKVDMEQATAMVYASAASVTTYFVNDPEAKKQIRNLMTQIRDISDKTGDIADRMKTLESQLNEAMLTATKVKGWSEALQADMKTAINYYNKTAAVAAQTERQKVKEGLIKLLKSENTKKLIAQQEKYRQLMRDDQEARETAQKILGERYKINTNIKWMKNRLTAETDQKNIPEEAKPLARMISKMLVLHDQSAMRKVLLADSKQLVDFADRLKRMDQASGEFEPERDLDFLVIKAPNAEDNDYTLRDRAWQDLMAIESGLLEYRSAEGQGKVSLKDREAALRKVREAVSELTTVIKRRGEAFISGKRYEVAALAEQFENEAQKSGYKGERRGRGSKQLDAMERALRYGNLTPEYFIKNLRNGVMNLLYRAFHDAEQNSGLEARDAQERVAKIAEKNGFASWDGQQKHTIKVNGGREITITTEQLMALYATWMREKNQMRPEKTAHLLQGGFVLTENDTDKGKTRREIIERRPVRMKAEQLDALGNELTDQQRAYVAAIVEYMSTDLAEIGNKASMDAYGIRKFTEKYYFPIKSWGGVLNRSSDKGVTSSNDNKAMRQSFSRRVQANAQNAIEISDFTPTAVKHIVGMITYNTVGPAVENLNKILNQQLTFGEKARDEAGEVQDDDTYKVNMGAAFKQHYGQAAYDYLVTFMKDINGGITQRMESSLREKLLTLFKKNAVAGSLSVAAQQPLSYIRAAVMINPKYLAAALLPVNWKGSYAEMMKYSGVAIIKKMGKFDMNYGRSMIDYITPEGMQKNKARAAYEWISEKSTSLPEKMDAITWARMWEAVKLEQAAQNKGVNTNSEAFLKQVAERFNEVMRRTQVYDSVMVKSQNMRSDKYLKKVATSFMAEPTLSLNVLADAWQNIGQPGGKKAAAKALATFMLSAAAQAGAKAFFGAGRSPDKKKTKKENWYAKFISNLLSEANPLGLIPGYSQMISVLEAGELKDDAMGVIGKAVDSIDKIFNLATGGAGKKGLYRDLEDSLGQLAQYATNIPVKNFMRDFRAMVNWFSGGTAGFTGDTYAQRETSPVVMKYQMLDTLVSTDLIGIVNGRLGEAGYDTTAAGYVKRLYEAQKTGNKKRAEEMNEFLRLAHGREQKTINSQVNTLVKDDTSTSAEEKQKLLQENEYGSLSSWVIDEYRKGEIDRKTADRMYREERPKATDKDVLEALDKVDYEKRTGRKPESYSNYLPLYDAIGDNKENDIKAAIKYMLDNGYTAKDIKTQLTAKYKAAYLAADQSGKRKIRDALQKAYKALGYTATDADKVINGWKNK